MKVLWLTSEYKLLKQRDKTDSYNGGGWVSSLQRLVEDEASIELGIAYLTNNAEKTERRTLQCCISIKLPVTTDTSWRYFYLNLAISIFF